MSIHFEMIVQVLIIQHYSSLGTMFLNAGTKHALLRVSDQHHTCFNPFRLDIIMRFQLSQVLSILELPIQLSFFAYFFMYSWVEWCPTSKLFWSHYIRYGGSYGSFKCLLLLISKAEVKKYAARFKGFVLW